MIETIKQLKGDFVVLDLGSAHSVGILRKMPNVMEAITLIEIDLHSNAAESPTDYFKRIKLKKAVAGKRGKRVFKQRKFPDCSSFLVPRPELIRAYGLEDYFVEMAAIEIECEPITELLLQEGVKRVDLLKTDLEGLDYEVLASDRELVSQALCVQSELRFQPFFQGERM